MANIEKQYTHASVSLLSPSFGPSAILHSRGGLPALLRILLPSPPSVVYSWQRFGGPEKRQDEREGGRDQGSGYSLFTLSDAIRCGLLLSMCDILNHAGRRRRSTDRRPTGTWSIVIMGRQLPMEWWRREEEARIISFPSHNAGADQNRAITFVFLFRR